jgi:ubiquinone/menaquinone biosynthesis C-methylase UbiE
MIIIKQPEQIHTYWNDLASEYDNIMGSDPTMCDLYTAILRELPTTFDSVLDLGTGTGSLLTLIHGHRPQTHLVGLDPAPAMLAQAHAKIGQNGNTTFILGSAHQIDAPDETFDVVVSNFALHHLTHAQKQECAYEVFRVLKPGGHFIFGDQHCRRMGTPKDKKWVEDIFDLFCTKARHYLDTAGLERMLLQVRLLPQFLLAEGELPATVEFWQNSLCNSGFQFIRVTTIQPEFIYHRVITAIKPKGML